MSAISAEPQSIQATNVGVMPYMDVLPQTRVRPLPREIDREIYRPRVQPRHRQAKSKARTQSAMAVFIARGTLFLALTAVTCATSSLAGQVMVEKARREGIRAAERASVAKNAEAALRTQVNLLTSDRSIETWAQENGFVTIDSTVGSDKSAATEAVGGGVKD